MLGYYQSEDPFTTLHRKLGYDELCLDHIRRTVLSCDRPGRTQAKIS